MYRKVCGDAVAGRGPVVVAAWAPELPAAAVVAIVDYRRYRRAALLRNPFMLVRILLGRLREHSSGGDNGPQAQVPWDLEPPPADLAGAWVESNATIAKTAYIGVAAPFRRKGLAQALYRKLFDELRFKGVKRLDATIRLDNPASIEMHRRLGFHLYSDGDRCLALKNLESE